MKTLSLGAIALVAMLFFSPATLADSLTSSGSSTVSVSDTVQVTSENCAGSTSICSESQTSGNFGNGFNISIPGITVPAGSTITGASLSFNFAQTTAQGNYSITSLSEVSWGYQYYAGTGNCGFLCTYPIYHDYYYSYYAPAYSVSGNLSGTFTSLTSPDNASTISFLNDGTLDLLALGFGSDLAAGDSLTLAGAANSNVNFYYFSTGDNTNTTANLFANLSSTPQATLEIDYTLAANDDAPTSAPEPGTLPLLGSGLLGILGFARRRVFS